MEVFLTVCDWDRFSKNDFLGQSQSIRVPHFTAADPIGKRIEYQVPLGDLSAEPGGIKMADKSVRGQGAITLAFVKVAHLCDVHFGMLQKRADSKILMSSKLNPRWTMVLGSSLMWFQSRHEIDKIKTVDLVYEVQAVTALPPTLDKKTGQPQFSFELDTGACTWYY